jgi:hypothetical protein
MLPKFLAVFEDDDHLLVVRYPQKAGKETSASILGVVMRTSETRN